MNTLFFTPEGVKGYNTDYMGFDRMLQAAGISLTGKRVTVLGNGGAAKAVLQVVADRKAETVQILSRHPQQAKESLQHFLAQRPDARVRLYAEAQPGSQVVINTTPVGMFPKVGVSPVPADFTVAPKRQWTSSTIPGNPSSWLTPAKMGRRPAMDCTCWWPRLWLQRKSGSRGNWIRI